MKLPNLFRKRTASDAARELSQVRIANERDRFKATTDELRARLGLPKWEWQ